MKDTKQQWFKEAAYDLFVHWGLYALLAGEYQGRRTENIAEWIMNDLDIPAAEYEKLAKEFDPKDFDADELVRRAKEDWGMKYLVFTSKHHEGFAMYHSACSAYNVQDASPCGRDILKELQLACEKYGMKLGLYYSQAQDWHDPDGYMHRKDNSGKDYQAYLERKCFPQLRELLTGYGPIALIWFDTPMETTPKQSEAMIKLVKELQPDCIVSGRIGNNMGEYMTTGDNFIPRLPYEGDWEVPATVNDTWGFSRFDTNWKRPEDIIRLLVKINGRGGNYLLNVGPDARGNVPERCAEILNEVGTYVRANGEALFGTKSAGVYPYELDFAEFTCKDHRLFVHVFAPVAHIDLYKCANHVKRVYLLETGEDIPFERTKSCEKDSVTIIPLPEHLRDRAYYCLGLELEERDLIFEEFEQ